MIETANRTRRRAYRLGHRAEWFAALALTLKGYRIVARRFRTSAGEVDIIARKRDLIVFVEVKARATEQAALDSISAHAQKRIQAAGEHWIARQKDYARLSWRFDVIAVLPWRWPKHYRDAW